MSYDLWGQMLGKARRRQLEGEVRVAVLPLLTQIAGGALTAAAVRHFGPGAGAIASAFVGGALKFGPPSGLMTPAAPGTVPLIPAIVQAISTAADKPKAAKQAKADQAALDAKTEADAQRQATSDAAEALLNAQQQAIQAQQAVDAERRAQWEAEAEQIAEMAAAATLKKYLTKTGQFSQAELGKAETAVQEAVTVAEDLPQTGVLAVITEGVKAAGDFVAGVLGKAEEIAKTEDAAKTEQPAKEAAV